MPSPEHWEQWARRPESHESTLADRARGELPEMESTKQLVELVGEVWAPGKRVLDVGCNAGHYLRGLRRLSPELEYTGVDAYAHYITQAREIFAGDPHARFELRDIRQPLYPEDPADITFCCNVLLHLPDFRGPVENLLASTSEVCLVRTLLGDRTMKVMRAATSALDEHGDPADFSFLNTWDRDHLRSHIESLGWSTELIEDQFDPAAISAEFEREVKPKDINTRVVEGKQLSGLLVLNWEWVKATRA